MEVNVRQFEFQVNEVLHCIPFLGKTNNIISSLFYLAQDGKTEVKPLDTDGLGFVFTDEAGTAEILRNDINDWLFRKGFEDSIVGLSKTLVEIYRFLNMYNLTQRYTEENPYVGVVEDLVKEIDTKSSRLPLPMLIAEIEKLLDRELPLREEILSINKVRNCLVHRIGIVSSNDTNNTEKDTLILRYLDLVLLAQTTNGLEVVTKEFKQKNEAIFLVSVKYELKQSAFNVGERIQIDADIFKSVTHTLICFIHEIVHLLPISDEIKKRFTPPFKVSLAVRE